MSMHILIRKRSRRRSAFLIGLGLSLAVLVAADRCYATLGEAEDSVASDEEALSTNRVSTTAYIGYTVQEIVSDAVTVREYVSPGGVIFAIAWNGLIHPDLTPLLGTYAAEYEDSLRRTEHEPGRGRLHVESNRVVVEKWGHMRNLQGRAYIPALIPTGVAVHEIR
jgi:hypothetical protein